MNALPHIDAVRDAAARIAPYATVTPVLRSSALDALAGAELHFKCENLQRGGAFKFRGACNAVWSLTEAEAARGVVTHSSGNHGNALALAAATRGIQAHVVVPEGAVQAKLDAIARAGGTLHRCAPNQAAREAMCAEVQARTGAAACVVVGRVVEAVHRRGEGIVEGDQAVCLDQALAVDLQVRVLLELEQGLGNHAAQEVAGVDLPVQALMDGDAGGGQVQGCGDGGERAQRAARRLALLLRPAQQGIATQADADGDEYEDHDDDGDQ